MNLIACFGEDSVFACRVWDGVRVNRGCWIRVLNWDDPSREQDHKLRVGSTAVSRVEHAAWETAPAIQMWKCPCQSVPRERLCLGNTESLKLHLEPG